MGPLTFSLSVTLDGCVDHGEGIADDETHAFFTRLMDESGPMLWGRVTYEMMESHWPAVARGDVDAPPTMREWAGALSGASVGLPTTRCNQITPASAARNSILPQRERQQARTPLPAAVNNARRP